MPAVYLDQNRADAFRPRATAYDVRDSDLTGFGLRILPSGSRRWFVHSQRRGQRIWKIIGDAAAVRADDARVRARALLAVVRRGGDVHACIATLRDTRFSTVGEDVLRHYRRHWKPATVACSLHCYRKYILPWFADARITEIDSRDIRRWFASLHRTPVAANRSLPVLSVILHQAELYGYRPEGSNPCRGIRRYRRPGRERFLSAAEYRRLGLVLARHEARWPLQIAVIRLLLLTGCRSSEIRTLEWSFCREGRLFLPDGKTGPRTVWLSAAARRVLDRLPRRARWVFPAPGRSGSLSGAAIFSAWRGLRAEADLRDVRLHDLRHSYASTALAQGESVLAIGRLLGHGDPATTLRYTHVADALVSGAAAAVGAALDG